MNSVEKDVSLYICYENKKRREAFVAHFAYEEYPHIMLHLVRTGANRHHEGEIKVISRPTENETRIFVLRVPPTYIDMHSAVLAYIYDEGLHIDANGHHKGEIKARCIFSNHWADNGLIAERQDHIVAQGAYTSYDKCGLQDFGPNICKPHIDMSAPIESYRHHKGEIKARSNFPNRRANNGRVAERQASIVAQEVHIVPNNGQVAERQAWIVAQVVLIACDKCWLKDVRPNIIKPHIIMRAPKTI